MILQILNRFRRTPLAAMSVVLLAAVLSASLCALHAANIAEQARYDDTVENVEVQLIVTNLSATRYTGLDAPTWVSDVFLNKYVDDSLSDYVKDIERMGNQIYDLVQIGDYQHTNGELAGISSLDVTGVFGQNTFPTWFEGYDESILATDALVCILPESMLPEDWDGSEPITVHAEFSYHHPPASSMGPYTPPQPTSYYSQQDYTVVGTHNSGDTIYVTFESLRVIYSELNWTSDLDGIRATLIDNSKIDEVRELSKAWFAEPNPTGERTPWDYSYYFYYPYALKIDTDLLDQAETTLKISILINELCAVLVFALSAGASFFVGFLMIRSRKQEIALMRTLGTRTVSIFLGFALEQVFCLLAGTALGGWLFDFKPMERLGLFVGVYATGLCLSLTVFLRKNLMTTIKEEE